MRVRATSVPATMLANLGDTGSTLHAILGAIALGLTSANAHALSQPTRISRIERDIRAPLGASTREVPLHNGTAKPQTRRRDH